MDICIMGESGLEMINKLTKNDEYIINKINLSFDNIKVMIDKMNVMSDKMNFMNDKINAMIVKLNKSYIE
jgi:hypothetical protein